MSEALELATQQGRIVSASDFMPLMTVQQAVERKNIINQFISGVLRIDEDYGKIPGAGEKKVLLKPGAEKLCSIFGLSVTYAEDKIIEDWTGADHGGEPLFYYSYRCQLSRGDRFMGEAIGSCNSWESKYRYRWVPEELAKDRPDFATLVKRGGRTTKFEPNFALDKKETSGQYGKPAEYWAMWDAAIKENRAKNVSRKLGQKTFDGWEMTMDQTQYRIPNPDVSDSINTCQKMAQKRALVAAVLVVTNCSDAFTQDIDDFAEFGGGTQTEDHFPTATATKPTVASTERPFPVELLAHFERIQKDIKQFPATVIKIQDMMIERAGAAGDDAYQAYADKVQTKYPKGTTNLKDIRVILMDLWDIYQQLPGPKGA
jgi:hypothetical protein